MKVLLEGPILTSSGYGEHCKLVFRSIKDLPGLELSINPLNWGQTSWSHVMNDEREQIDQAVKMYSSEMNAAQSTNTPPDYAIQIHVGILNEFEKKAPYSVCVTAGIETDRVAPNWLSKSHQGVDKIIVPSEHAKSGFVDTKYEIINQTKNTKTVMDVGCPVEVVPYPVKNKESKHLDFKLDTDFNFVCVALLGFRKNLENLIKWFLEEFKEESVGLILKTGRGRGSIMDREATKTHLSNLISEDADRKCKVYLLHGDLSEEELHSLYTRDDTHAYVSSAHGEGYGLPIFEAAYSGMPVVATDWSGHLDFLVADFEEGKKTKRKKLFARVDYDLQEIPKHVVWEDILIEGSMWAVPKEHSLKRQMRNVYANYGMYKSWAKSLQSSVLKSHENRKIKEKMKAAIFSPAVLEKLNNKEEDFFWFDEEQVTKYD